MSNIKTIADALVAWYALPERERSIFQESAMPADEKRELLKVISGHLDSQMLAIDMASMLRMLWTGVTNKDAGYKQQDLINSLSVCEELATLLALTIQAKAEVGEVRESTRRGSKTTEATND